VNPLPGGAVLYDRERRARDATSRGRPARKGVLMRIRVSRNQVPGLVRSRSRARVGCTVAVWSALLVLFCLWRPAGVPVAALLSLVLGSAWLVHACWAAVRHRRLVRQALAEAVVREERLAAALSHGPYRPSPPAGAADPGARRRRDLLDAVERHGGLSPQARVAAAEITRHRTR